MPGRISYRDPYKFTTAIESKKSFLLDFSHFISRGRNRSCALCEIYRRLKSRNCRWSPYRLPTAVESEKSFRQRSRDFSPVYCDIRRFCSAEVLRVGYLQPPRIHRSSGWSGRFFPHSHHLGEDERKAHEIWTVMLYQKAIVEGGSGSHRL